jgi:hypothetical protein
MVSFASPPPFISNVISQVTSMHPTIHSRQKIEVLRLAKFGTLATEHRSDVRSLKPQLNTSKRI